MPSVGYGITSMLVLKAGDIFGRTNQEQPDLSLGQPCLNLWFVFYHEVFQSY